ncbi:hypothetical protein EVAR_68823_1 [Eumeta japonica]|uniref:Uncharacterized protein n=1 Tax=Eumeta variegata TaxID=151549 RepID=A0A4C1Z1B4_EUMVA|nr:hypothetical protein EVAR_68823_1 [Eumeta japonica]
MSARRHWLRITSRRVRYVVVCTRVCVACVSLRYVCVCTDALLQGENTPVCIRVIRAHVRTAVFYLYMTGRVKTANVQAAGALPRVKTPALLSGGTFANSQIYRH